jgi:hypothetical protein
MKRIISLLVLLMPSAYAASLPGASAQTVCHDRSVYTRKDRNVQPLDALKEQLASCTHMANKNLSGSERQNLLKYLDDQFYHF